MPNKIGWHDIDELPRMERREAMVAVADCTDADGAAVPVTDALQSIALELRALRELEERRLAEVRGIRDMLEKIDGEGLHVVGDFY